MDLRNRVTYAYEVIEFKAPELGRVVKQLYNKTFTYKWLYVTHVHFRIAPDGTNIYQFRAFDGAGITYYLTSFIYFEENNTLIKAPKEIAEATAKIIEEFYAKPISEVLGIPVKTVALDPTNYCTWDTQPKTQRVGEVIGCKRINELDIVKVAYYVSPINKIRFCKFGSGCAGLSEKTAYIPYPAGYGIDAKYVDESTVLHEFGHQVGLGDLYRTPRDALNETLWALAAWKDSIMHSGLKLSLLDFAHVLSNTWGEVFIKNKELASKLSERAIQYGINLSNDGVSLLVPVTGNGELVELFKDIAPTGVAELVFNERDGRTYINHHPEVLNIMKVIYKAATANAT